MSDLKALLLQMKLDTNYEMRILAEETIVNMFDDLRAENERLKQQVVVYEESLKIVTLNDENKSRLHIVDKETMHLIILHADSIARKALKESE